MKKEIIIMQQKVVLEYEDEAGRKEAIKALKAYPNSTSIWAGDYRFRKHDSPVKIIIQVRTPIK